MHEPSASQSRPRLGCLAGTFSPSRRQIRSTRLSLTTQPASPQQLRDLAIAVAAVLPGQLDDVGGQPLLVVTAPRAPCAASSDAVRAPHRHDARIHAARARTCSMQARRRAGLRSFPWQPPARISLSSVRSETALRSRRSPAPDPSAASPGRSSARHIFTGQVSIVDVGEVNGRIFVNNSGFGFYPHFVRQREELERRGHVKRVAFMLALRAVVRRYFRLRINVHMGEAQALEHLMPFLFVGNNRYQTSGFEIGRRLRLDSGRLWVCTAPRANRENPLQVALRTLFGGATDQALNAFETEAVTVRPDTPRVNVSTDGEVSLMDTPLHYRIALARYG